MEAIKLLIADDEFITRQGIKSAVESSAFINVVDEVETRSGLFKVLSDNTPDVLIMDYCQYPEFELADVKVIVSMYPNVKLVLISNTYNKALVNEAMQIGVTCFLTKKCDQYEIVESIKSAKVSKKFFCNKILRAVVNINSINNVDCSATNLTPRELEILKAVAMGLTTAEIADSLCLSGHTVSTHRKNIIKKVGIKNQTELLKYASRMQEFAA